MLDAVSGIPEMPSSTTGPEIAKGFIEVQRPVALANSLIHVPPDGRAITPMPFFSRPQTRKIDAIDSSQSSISESMSSSTSYPSVTTSSAPNVSAERLDDSQDIYDEIIEMAQLAESTVPTLPSFIISASDRPANQTPEVRKTAGKSHQDASFFVGNAGNIGADQQRVDGERADDLNKLLKAIPDEIRRSPLKASLTDARAVNEGAGAVLPVRGLDEGKSFIAEKQVPIPTIKSISMTVSKQDDRMERLLSPASDAFLANRYSPRFLPHFDNFAIFQQQKESSTDVVTDLVFQTT
ncbi:unnamed protein product [Gongylonema pulchrum]|uniref:Uncharacterized protein n=1 Tax=Gongylonema pulchrum TaxID=637853 RepID=A0A3P6QQN0_9BILA|nr:unnamed protein product [Gongylonema pulchrum]